MVQGKAWCSSTAAAELCVVLMPALGPCCCARDAREEGVVEARSMDAALQALTLDSKEADRHPEK